MDLFASLSHFVHLPEALILFKLREHWLYNDALLTRGGGKRPGGNFVSNCSSSLALHCLRPDSLPAKVCKGMPQIWNTRITKIDSDPCEFQL